MRVFLLSASLLVLVLGSFGCAHHFAKPSPITKERTVRDLGLHFHDVFPEPEQADRDHDAGLLHPRFGAPIITQRTTDFPIEILERGGRIEVRAALLRVDLPGAAAAQCLGSSAPVPVEDCIPLQLEEISRTTMDETAQLSVRTLRARPQRPATAHIYDLYVVSAVDPPQRAPRAVFLSDGDPQTPRDIKVVQISDLHLGKLGNIAAVPERLDREIRTINELAPDLVIVTGDLAEQGHHLGLEQAVAAILLKLEPPLLIMPGNHDYGHFPKLRGRDDPDHGWLNFSRVFHPYRFAQLSFAGWLFVGFDSGPSMFSPRILTRGIDAKALSMIRGSIDEAAQKGLRGVVLYSHAPTRAVLRSNREQAEGDGLGSMVAGAAELEGILLDAARRKQRVLHLSGHTHWADVFTARPTDHGMDFARWLNETLPCPRVLDGTVAMINAPSATLITFPILRHGRAYGFVELTLDAQRTVIRYDLRDRHNQPVLCAGGSPPA